MSLWGCPLIGQAASGMEGDVSLICCCRMERGVRRDKPARGKG